MPAPLGHIALRPEGWSMNARVLVHSFIVITVAILVGLGSALAAHAGHL
jgi:hypothetical protein